MSKFIIDIIHMFNAEILSVLPDRKGEEMFILITDVHLECQECHAEFEYTFDHRDQIELSDLSEISNHPQCNRCHSTNVIVSVHERDMKEEISHDTKDTPKTKKAKKGTNGNRRGEYQKNKHTNTFEERVMSLRQRVEIEQMYLQLTDNV